MESSEGASLSVAAPRLLWAEGASAVCPEGCARWLPLTSQTRGGVQVGLQLKWQEPWLAWACGACMGLGTGVASVSLAAAGESSMQDV